MPCAWEPCAAHAASSAPPVAVCHWRVPSARQTTSRQQAVMLWQYVAFSSSNIQPAPTTARPGGGLSVYQCGRVAPWHARGRWHYCLVSGQAGGTRCMLSGAIPTRQYHMWYGPAVYCHDTAKAQVPNLATFTQSENPRTLQSSRSTARACPLLVHNRSPIDSWSYASPHVRPATKGPPATPPRCQAVQGLGLLSADHWSGRSVSADIAQHGHLLACR